MTLTKLKRMIIERYKIVVDEPLKEVSALCISIYV